MVRPPDIPTLAPDNDLFGLRMRHHEKACEKGRYTADHRAIDKREEEPHTDSKPYHLPCTDTSSCLNHFGPAKALHHLVNHRLLGSL